MTNFEYYGNPKEAEKAYADFTFHNKEWAGNMTMVDWLYMAHPNNVFCFVFKNNESGDDSRTDDWTYIEDSNLITAFNKFVEFYNENYKSPLTLVGISFNDKPILIGDMQDKNTKE